MKIFFARGRMRQLVRLTFLLPVIPLVFALWNLIGWLLDATVRGEEFTFDHLIIGQRDEDGARTSS